MTVENINGAQLFNFKNIVDSRGSLTVGNFQTEIPFLPKRYFIVYGVSEDQSRGVHAHKECHQFLICTSGSVKVEIDNGLTKAEVTLSSPNQGLYLPPKIWGTQHYCSKETCLLVFASHYYDKEDYISDYQEFINLKKS